MHMKYDTCAKYSHIVGTYQAARRERKEFAEVESDRTSKKLLDNLMQSHAVKEVLGETSGQGSSKGSRPSSSKAKADMFELPPLPENFQRFV